MQLKKLQTHRKNLNFNLQPIYRIDKKLLAPVDLACYFQTKLFRENTTGALLVMDDKHKMRRYSQITAGAITR